MGRGKATRYARARAVAPIGYQMPIFEVDAFGAITSFGSLHLLWGGHHWLEKESGVGEFSEGLPIRLTNMVPQGFSGRSFSTRFPELALPQRIPDWTDDHRLISLALRGEDCAGNLVVGNESLKRMVQHEFVNV